MQISSMGGSQLADMLQQMQQKVQTSFSAADVNGDGKLSKTEFSAFDAAMKAGAPQGANGAGKAMPTADDMTSQLFGKLDSDGDGSVTMTEIQAHAPPALSADGMSALLKMQEADDSNTSPVMQAFKAADTDGDGKLSKTEFAAFDTAMKANGQGGAGRAHHGGGTKMTADQVFDALDTNQDGTVSAEELAAGTPPPPPTPGTDTSSTDSGNTSDMLASLIQQLLASYKQNSGTDIVSTMTTTAVSA